MYLYTPLISTSRCSFNVWCKADKAVFLFFILIVDTHQPFGTSRVGQLEISTKHADSNGHGSLSILQHVE